MHWRDNPLKSLTTLSSKTPPTQPHLYAPPPPSLLLVTVAYHVAPGGGVRRGELIVGAPTQPPTQPHLYAPRVLKRVWMLKLTKRELTKK